MVPRPHRPISDPAVRDEMLTLLYAGHGIQHACKAAGVSPGAFGRYRKQHPEYQAEVEAALDGAAEPVLAMLRRKAVEDEDVTAAKEYLKHAAPPARSERREVTVKHEHELSVDPAKLASVQELAESLARKQQAIDI